MFLEIIRETIEQIGRENSAEFFTLVIDVIEAFPFRGQEQIIEAKFVFLV